MDLNAIRTVDRRALVDLAGESAQNAAGLLADAELLLESGRLPRAYSLALLASEEYGKAHAVLTLSFMTPRGRSEIPDNVLRALLQGHRPKAAGAELVRVVQAATPGLMGRIAGMDMAAVLAAAAQHSTESNRAKEHGLYVDLH